MDAAIAFLRAHIAFACIEAATGAGKSHMIAAIARFIHELTGKRILCLAPSAELVMQNREKYLATGNPCSTFSASAGAKELRHPVVFGSPLTVKNRISRFCKPGAEGYALVVVDECHGVTPTVQGIISAMREANPNLRVLGLTATPYRLGSGYVFQEWPDGRINGPHKARDPYFAKCVYRVDARSLIAQGYLTPPVIGATEAKGYDTSALVADARGRFDAAEVDRAYHGHGRKTAAIVGDVVRQAQDRRGVLMFAATVRHAEEVMASLPPSLSAIVTADTKKSDRDRILREFKAQRLKYLVNVAVLTTGFDAPHVDLIAMLRKTESVGLLQQIVGRGLRLSPGKADCLVLDYTTNIEDHCPDGDLFSPKVKARPEEDGKLITVWCPKCQAENEFKRRPNISDDAETDKSGYLVDLNGNPVETEHGPMPSHFGRRCYGLMRDGRTGDLVQCDYRWTSKPCPNCDAENDIAARYCEACKCELVNPNEKLRGEWRAFKKDPTQRQTDRIVNMEWKPNVSSRGNPTIRVDVQTEWRSFSVWLMAEPTFSRAQRELAMFEEATNMMTRVPRTVTYQKEPSGFYRIYAYDRPHDEEPGSETDAA